MALLPTDIDYDSIETQDEFTVIPAGEYVATIVASEEKETKAGDGSYIEMRIQILEGEYAKRNVFCRLNLNNRNPKAVEIAYRTLKSILVATGVHSPKDTSELHDIPLVVKVKVRPATDNYGESNDVVTFKPARGGIQRDVENKMVKSGSGKKPWER